MPAIFITATGTDIGKTYVTAGLASCLHHRGRAVAVLKPVVAGFDEADFATSDPALLLKAVDETPSLAAISAVSPWRLRQPLSPDMVARNGGPTIDFAKLFSFCRKAAAEAEDVLLIEGIGGLMVPLDACTSVLDLIALLPVAPVLVTGTYLGSLSHALTACEAIRHRGLELGAIVVNETAGSPISPDETAASLQHFCTETPIVILARGCGHDNADDFERLADLVAPPA